MRAASAVLAATLLLAGCGQVTAVVPGQAPSATPTAEPSRLPDGTPLLVARATILDSGHGPELCVGAVAASSPPQCGGPKLRDWTWPRSGVERANGVTWGAFDVVGTYARDTFTVVKRISAEEAARSIPEPAAFDFHSVCAEPAGGWRPVDSARSSEADRETVLTRAESLPGYAGAWVDDHGDQSQNPQTTTVNVLVTHDLEAAEQSLRQVWGGPLCVGTNGHSYAELKDVLDEVSQRAGFLSSGIEVGTRGSRIRLEVVYDDGALQREMDQRYGTGLVEVSSSLQPYLG